MQAKFRVPSYPDTSRIRVRLALEMLPAHASNAMPRVNLLIISRAGELILSFNFVATHQTLLYILYTRL